LVKTPRLPGPSDPEEFPQVEPTTELHPTNNIRFVMWEVARLTEKVDQLSTSIDKLAGTFEKASDKQTAALKDGLADHSADVKERLNELKAPIDEIKADVKEAKKDLIDVGKKVAFVKGVTWVLGGMFAVGVVILGAIARKLIGG
jgi:ElaB/YqjD/DUF883 family membrane-anchored ribosome-binding protein